VGRGPNPDREPRPTHPLPPPGQDLRRLAGLPTRTRQLDMAITHRPHLPSQRHRHPSPRQHRIRRNHMARRHRPSLRLLRIGHDDDFVSSGIARLDPHIQCQPPASAHRPGRIAGCFMADRLHDPATVITRSARGKLCAISTALSWSVVRAQLFACSWLIPCN
jgi:hypothetical protein